LKIKLQEEYTIYSKVIAKMQMELYTESKNDKKKKFSNLKKLLLNDEVLYAAWKDVRQNTKAAGIDLLTVNRVEEEGVIEFIKTIKAELKHNSYRGDFVRGIKIPRPDGKERHIGILTVKDRVVQAAVKLILEPIFEADFDETSFGFRAFRSTRLASLEAYKWLEAGNDYVFKSDIEKCFDSIPHRRLLSCLENRILDKYILSIIESWLSASVIEVTHVDYPEKGVLQGGIISPLLVNIYLDQFDNRWLEIGLKSHGDDFKGHLVRYADDFVILSKERIEFEYVQGILTELGLGLNKNKTLAVRARDGFEFLGFYFVEMFPDSKYQRKIRIYPTEGSVERVIQSIKEVTALKYEGNHAPGIVMQEIIKDVDAWVNYYQHTDYYFGIERICKCVNEEMQRYMEGNQNENIVDNQIKNY
jgi:RNA-directed DNA polymerase